DLDRSAARACASHASRSSPTTASTGWRLCRIRGRASCRASGLAFARCGRLHLAREVIGDDGAAHGIGCDELRAAAAATAATRPAISHRAGEHVQLLRSYLGRELFQRANVVEHKQAAAVRGYQQIMVLLVELHVIDRD